MLQGCVVRCEVAVVCQGLTWTPVAQNAEMSTKITREDSTCMEHKRCTSRRLRNALVPCDGRVYANTNALLTSAGRRPPEVHVGRVAQQVADARGVHISVLQQDTGHSAQCVVLHRLMIPKPQVLMNSSTHCTEQWCDAPAAASHQHTGQVYSSYSRKCAHLLDLPEQLALVVEAGTREVAPPAPQPKLVCLWFAWQTMKQRKSYCTLHMLTNDAHGACACIGLSACYSRGSAINTVCA